MAENESQSAVESGGRVERFPLTGYLIINLVVWAFMGAAIGFIAWYLGDSSGLASFFVILGGAFSLVSIFDAVYDRVATRGAVFERASPQRAASAVAPEEATEKAKSRVGRRRPRSKSQ